MVVVLEAHNKSDCQLLVCVTECVFGRVMQRGEEEEEITVKKKKKIIFTEWPYFYPQKTDQIIIIALQSVYSVTEKE